MQLPFDEAPEVEKSDINLRLYHKFDPNRKGENYAVRYSSRIYQPASKERFHITDITYLSFGIYMAPTVEYQYPGYILQTPSDDV